MAEDPTRLLDEGGSALLHSLLEAAREEQPDHAALQRTLTAVGVGAAAAVASTAGASAAHGLTGAASLGSAKGVASGTLLVVAKWLGAGALAGVMATSAIYAVSKPPLPATSAKAATRAPEQAAAPARVARASAPTVPASAEPPPAESASVAPVVVPPLTSQRVAPPAVSVPAEVDPGAQLAAELGLLDSARKAVAAGNAASALRALNEYDSRFAHPNLLPEALYLRLEALTLEGDKSGTEAVARRILRSYPTGPHAARARAVLGLDP